MNRRQFVLSAFGASLAALALEGCGGGGGATAGGGSLQKTRGAVKLPAGSTITFAQLAVGNSIGTNSVGADGSFTASTDANAPEVVLLTHTSGRGVMFGFLDPGSVTNVLDEHSQAVALLYLVLGGYSFPVDRKRDVLALIQKDPATPTLAAVISQRIASNSFALEDGDAQIAAAVQTAYNAMIAEGGGSKSVLRPLAMAQNSKSPASLKSRASAVPLQLLVDPTVPQSGVEVVQDTANTSITGIVATNHYRRRCQVLLYRVGDDSTGTRVDYPAAQLSGAPVSLPATTRIGLNTAITGLFGGTSPFAPVSTNTLPLTLAPSSTKTFYETIVLGATNGTLPDPAFVSDPKYAKEVAAWTATREDLNLQSMLIDLFFGLALEMLGFGGVVPLDSQVQAAYAAINAIPDVPVRTLLQHASSTGGIGIATIDLLKLAAGSDTVGSNLRKQLALLLQNATQQAALEASSGLSVAVLNTMLKMLLSLVNLAQLGLGAGDISAIIHDLTVSASAERWTETLLQPVVSISPASSTISGGSHQTLTAKLPTGVTGTILYDWATTATFALLSDGAGKTGRSFESSAATVDLATTPSDVSPVKVTVTVIQVGLDGSRRTIGDATATVTLSATGPKTVTAGYQYLEAFYPVDSGTAFIAVGFFTFNEDPSAVEYDVSDSSGVSHGTLMEADVKAGAPVLTTANLGAAGTTGPGFPGYRNGSVQNGFFFNMGNGVIGNMAFSTRGDQSQAAIIRQQVMDSAKGKVGTVTISYR